METVCASLCGTLQGDFAVCLRGNHEEMMVRCKDRPIDWLNFAALDERRICFSAITKQNAAASCARVLNQRDGGVDPPLWIGNSALPAPC